MGGSGERDVTEELRGCLADLVKLHQEADEIIQRAWGEIPPGITAQFKGRLLNAVALLNQLHGQDNPYSSAIREADVGASPFSEVTTVMQEQIAMVSAGLRGLNYSRSEEAAPGTEPAPVSHTPPDAAANRSQFEYDVALSFAGEDREYVKAVAQALQNTGVQVFYDGFEEAALWGKNLFEHLTEVYSKRARYCIIFGSAHYAQKIWPTAERRAAQARALQSKGEYILPARFDDSEIPGILGTVGYIDLRQKSPEELAAIFLSKLGRSAERVQPDEPRDPTPNVIRVSGHAESWEQRALGRFEYLRKARIDKAKGDPFARGYWQASFALQGELRDTTLAELLEVLRASETNRTGWDVGWMPTREGIAPYPYQGGIEVWLVEDGGKGSGHSDFWRGERIGTFSLFRGYQDDEEEFSRQFPQIQLDYSLVLWRVAEVLLYLENFSRNLAAAPVGANLRIRWTGLENRRLGNHNEEFPSSQLRVCHQPSVESELHVADTSQMKRTLIPDVRRITCPLLEAFDFFSLSEEQVRFLVRGVFDADKEGGI